MMRLIDADEVYKILTEFYHHRTDMQHTALKEALDRVPTIETVSVGTLEQFIWERDIAIGQLNEIGKDLGSKMDNVITVVKCKDCILDREAQCPMKYATEPDDYCSFGERIDGEKT